MSHEFDLVIRGGLVVDGTGNEPFQADIAVAGGRITAIGNIVGRTRASVGGAQRMEQKVQHSFDVVVVGCGVAGLSAAVAAAEAGARVAVLERSADRKFKPPFSLSATLSPARQAVNRTVFGENFALSMIIRTPHRPEAAHRKAV